MLVFLLFSFPSVESLRRWKWLGLLTTSEGPCDPEAPGFFAGKVQPASYSTASFQLPSSAVQRDRRWGLWEDGVLGGVPPPCQKQRVQCNGRSGRWLHEAPWRNEDVRQGREESRHRCVNEQVTSVSKWDAKPSGGFWEIPRHVGLITDLFHLRAAPRRAPQHSRLPRTRSTHAREHSQVENPRCVQ